MKADEDDVEVKSEQCVFANFEHRITHEIAERCLEGMPRRLAGATVGTRNKLLSWAAFHAGHLVRERRIGSSVVEARLTQAALAAGLSLPEISKTIQNGIYGEMK
jgi:hypothetical protein